MSCTQQPQLLLSSSAAALAPSLPQCLLHKPLSPCSAAPSKFDRLWCALRLPPHSTHEASSVLLSHMSRPRAPPSSFIPSATPTLEPPTIPLSLFAVCIFSWSAWLHHDIHIRGSSHDSSSSILVSAHSRPFSPPCCCYCCFRVMAPSLFNDG